MYSKIYDFYTAEGNEPNSYFRISFLNECTDVQNPRHSDYVVCKVMVVFSSDPTSDG